MNKLILIATHLSLLIFLFSCTWFQNETLDDYFDVFAITELNLSQFTYHETSPYQLFDRVLMVHLTSSSLISHLIVSSTDVSLERDDKVKIDTEFIYMTRDFKKTRHSNDGDFNQFFVDGTIDHYVFMAEHFFTKEGIQNLIENGSQFKLSKNRQQYVLKFYIPYEDYERVNLSVQIVYTVEMILEFHYRFEHDYESTKQQNNYIYGYHVYFGYDENISFPSLDLFTEN